MERRKILLGSGAALATALAGCSSSDTSDDESSDDDTTSINDNDDTGDNGDNGDNGDELDVDDIPGFDGKKLVIDSDAVTVEKIERKDDKVHVVASTDVTDHEKLYEELESIAEAHDEAAVDLEEFADKIKTIEWTVDHDDKKVVSFYVDVQWIVDYHEGKLSKKEVHEKVKDTAE